MSENKIFEIPERKDGKPSEEDINFMRGDLILRMSEDFFEWDEKYGSDFSRIVKEQPELFFGYADAAEEDKAHMQDRVKNLLASRIMEKAA